MTDFIEIYDGFMTETECDQTIELFNKMQSIGATYQRIEKDSNDNIQKHDESIGLFDANILSLPSSAQQLNYLVSRFWFYYNKYAEKYPTIATYKAQSIVNIKVQKTLPGQGYHVWHFENSSYQNSRRNLVWCVYLNDVFEGGETEFLYLGKRMKPKKGSLVIWPAGWTHTHRGNPPLIGEKYLMTSWVESNVF